MKFLARLVVALGLLLPLTALAQDKCTYFGGYPWRTGGCLTSTDLNTAIATALQPPTTLSTGVAAANLGSAAGDITGTWASTRVVGLQSFAVANITPTDGQILTWKTLTNRWEPSSLSAAGGDISGTFGALQVTGLQTRPVAATAPTVNQALAWNGSQWAPATVVGLGATPGAYGTALISTGAGNPPDFKPIHGSGTLWAPPGTTAFGPPTLAYIATQPDGTAITCTTTSNCVQEFLNAVLPKAGADLYGGGGATGSLANPSILGTLAVPLLRNTYVHLHGGGLFQSGTPAPNTPFVTFDSAVEASFGCEGCQIVSAATTTAAGGVASGSMPAALFDPHTVLPFEAFTGIGASHFNLGNTAVQWSVGQSDSVVKATMTHGGITQSFIEALEINGGGPSSTTTGAVYGYLITGQVGGNAYYGNLNKLGYIHLVSAAGLQEGLNKAEGTYIAGNIYDINNIEPRGAGSKGLSTYAQASSYRVGVMSDNAGTLGTCLSVEAGVSDSNFDVGCRANGVNSIATGVSFNTDGVNPANNNSAVIRVSGVGNIAALVKDAGLNNFARRGATFYSATGLTFYTVNSTGAQSGGSLLTGTSLSLATGAFQGALFLGPTADCCGGTASIVRFGAASQIFLEGGGGLGGGVNDPSLYLHVGTSGTFFFQNPGGIAFQINPNEAQPGTDAVIGLGDLTHRFTNAYLSGSLFSADNAQVTTASFTKTSDTTLAAIPGLTQTLAAGGRYSCYGHLVVSNGAAGGIKIAVTAPAGSTLSVTAFSNTVRVLNGTTTQINTTSAVVGVAIAATVQATDVFIDAGIEVNAGGAVVVQAAQNVSDATPLTIGRDSSFQCKRGTI